MKKFITFVLVLASFCMFAGTFSWSFNQAELDAYLVDQENFADKNYQLAVGMQYILQNPNTTVAELMEVVGEDRVFQITYFCDSSKIAALKESAGRLRQDIISNADAYIGYDRFKMTYIAYGFARYNSATKLALANKLGANNIRQIVSDAINKRIAEAKRINAFKQDIVITVEKYLASYSSCMVLCDEDVVKEDLRLMNVTAYELLLVDQNYRSMVTRLRVLYKSFDL